MSVSYEEVLKLCDYSAAGVVSDIGRRLIWALP